MTPAATETARKLSRSCKSTRNPRVWCAERCRAHTHLLYVRDDGKVEVTCRLARDFTRCTVQLPASVESCAPPPPDEIDPPTRSMTRSEMRQFRAIVRKHFGVGRIA